MAKLEDIRARFQRAPDPAGRQRQKRRKLVDRKHAKCPNCQKWNVICYQLLQLDPRNHKRVKCFHCGYSGRRYMAAKSDEAR